MRQLYSLFLAAICFFLFSASPLMAQLFRQADLSPDGQNLAFSYQGDIWAVSANGGQARRLTVHESYESQARWSPDGQQIAFTGNRYGNNDVFVTNASGAYPSRLTYHSTSDNEPVWMNNQQLLFTTRRNYRQVERVSEFHQVGTSGGTPQRIMDDLGSMPAVSPDGRYIAYIRGGCRVSREAYRGPANRDLWVYDTQTKQYTQLTKDEGQDVYPRWDDNGQIYFLSARNGRYNLFRTSMDSNAPQPLTRFTDEGIRHFSMSADGSKFVIEKGVQLLAASSDMKFSPLQIDITEDFKFYPSENKTLTTGVSEFQLSPNGKQLAFGSRGELFVKPNDKDKKRARNLTEHSWRDHNFAWLNDSTALFLSDRDGQYDLYAIQSSDASEIDLYKTFKKDTKRLTQTSQDESFFAISPDHKKMVMRQGRGKLSVFEVAADGALSNEKVLLDGWDTPGGVSWSPDSKWLAYSLSDLDFNEDIFIHPADNSSAAVNVSLHPRGDYSPQWSRDGSKLGFLSVRNNGDADVWFVWLKEEDWEKTQRDWEEDEDDDTDKKDKKDQDTPIQIDFKDIHKRLVQITSLPGNEGNLLIGPKGETFFFTTNGGGRTTGRAMSDLMRVKWDGSELKPLLAKARVRSLRLNKAGKKIYMLKDGKVASTPLEKGKAESQSFTARMKLHHQTEREQMFEEGWRALRDGFYDPSFHGQDWEDLKKHYKPMAMMASTRQDFQTIYNEMLGQLNASHMGFRSPVQDEDLQRERTGLLGVEFKVENGIFVKHIIPDGPADREESKLMVGDQIREINGELIVEQTNIYQLLEGTTSERTLLTIERDGEEMELVIRPTASLSTVNYEAWVSKRKELTERYSNGRLGYIHIRGMNWPSFERFERELTASGYGKDGIVIDVRYNGGGWTTDMLMTVLNVKQHSYTIPRGAAKTLEENGKFRPHYPFGERLPLSALTKPSVALCNEASYSNAEIFSHAYKTLGHGTLVGQPTFGAVISTGSYRLIDGSSVRMPYRAWYVSATQENMEGGPAVPDVIVVDPPGIKAQNEDPQLKKSVEILLEQIK